LSPILEGYPVTLSSSSFASAEIHKYSLDPPVGVSDNELGLTLLPLASTEASGGCVSGSSCPVILNT
jgi:hypothetical protein